MELVSQRLDIDESQTPVMDFPAGITMAAWEAAAPHVWAYLRALGVRTEKHLQVLSGRVRARWERRLVADPELDPAETAIEEVNHSLNEWLRAELRLSAGDIQELLAARAALLDGAADGWIEHWVYLTPADLAPALEAARLQAVPEYRESAMPVQSIELRGIGLGRRLAAALRQVMAFFGYRRS